MSSDPTVVSHCFTSETKYLTEDGWATLGETVGSHQRVLSRVNGAPQWVDAEINEFGEQEVWEVVLRRNQRSMIVRTTAGHRWITRGKGGRTQRYRDQPVSLTTEQLSAGTRLDWCLPISRLGISHPAPVGIMHGFTYGDGARAQRGSKVTLWGEKDRALLPYFVEHRMAPAKTPLGVLGTSILDLPGFFKDRPSLGEATHYLYGFLAGWFAADGSVDPAGQATLASASYEDLEFAQQVALALGVSTYPIVTAMRLGYGDEPSALYSLTFIGSTLRSPFFIIPEHATRWMAKQARGNPERFGWTVESVVNTGVVEPVFCATVPEYHSFTIDGFIHTGNCCFCGSGAITGRSDGGVECSLCSRVFIVMEQPLYSGMPSADQGASVNALPTDPLGQHDPFEPGAEAVPPAPAADPAAPVDPAAAQVPGQPAAAPVAPAAAPVAPVAPAPVAAPVDPRRPIPMFASRSGVLLGEEDFVTHHAARLVRGN